jgi:RNA polymerase sporulation-specific sigma factor
VDSVAVSDKFTITETAGDEELAELARQGSEQAFSLLVSRFAPMIKRQVVLYRDSQLEAEDLAQEGLLALLAAARSFDSNMASFRTYASVCVKNRILSAVRGLGAARQIPKTELISIDDEEEAPLTIVGCSEDPAQLVIQKDEVLRLQVWLRGLLSPQEYQVLLMYLGAFTYQEISKHLGIGVKAVDNSLQRIRRKMVTVSFPGG